MKKLTTIFIILIASIATINAQQVYPVNATGTLIPPFSTVLSDYANTKSQDLMFTLTLNDPIELSRQVYFRLTVKHNFTAIYQTDPNFATQPITLQQFQPEMLTGSDLAAYLNVNALQAVSGTSVSNLLPDGFNQICLEVMDFQRRVPISREICVGGFFQKLDAPLLDLPTCGATANISTTQNLMFRWQPRHLGQPNAPASVQYIFKIVELQPGFTNPFDVFDLSPQIYQTTVSTPTLFYTDAEPQLQEGKTYAWRVQATDGSTANVFQNDGKSPVCTFTVTKNKTNPANNTPNNIIPSCGANLTNYGPITYSNPKSGLIAVGDAIKLGYFDMKITQLNSTGDSYSGEATVHIPFLKAHVLVEFFDLKIDPNKQVYEVTKVSAKRDVNMGLNPNDLTTSGLARKVNQSNLLNQLNAMVKMPTAGGRKVSQRNDADQTPIGLPLIMDRSGLPSVVLLDFQFSAIDAKLVAIGIDEDSQNQPMPLTGVNIPFTPHGIGQNQGLNLTNDYEYTLTNGSIVKLLANQTNAKLDCNGFAGYDLKGIYVFDRNVALPTTTNPTDKVAAMFTGKGDKLTDFVADITQMPDFTIPTIKDYVFTLENGKLDLSNTSNPTNINFPTVYTDTKNNDWQGFSFGKVKVKMPNQWTFGNQTNTSNLELTNGQIVINDDGMYANLSQDNLVTLADGKVKDWNISVDKFELEIAKSKTGNSNITGEIKLPVLDKALTYKGDLTTNQNGDVNIEVKPQGINAKMSMWYAEMNFDTSAVAKIMTRNINNTKSFIPYGSLSGEINIEIDSSTFVKNIIGNAGGKLTRLKQALDFKGDADLKVSNIILDGFVIDPTNIAAKRYMLKNYEKSLTDLDVIIGGKAFAPNTIQIFYEPKTANEPNKLGLEIAVQNNANVVSIIIWAKQEANGQFVFSHIDTDSRLVDCDCTSLEDWEKYRGYGSRTKYNEEVLLASNDANINDYRITADKFPINATNDKITIPYLKNMEISVQLRGNEYIAQTTSFANQNPDFIKNDANATASVPALDLSNFKIDDNYLQGLVGHMSKSSRNKLPIDLSNMLVDFLGKYDKTKYPFPANSHLILTGITFDASLEKASGQVILVVKQDGKWITFGNGDVLLEPKAVGFKTLNLYLTEDIKNTNAKLPFTHKKALKNNPQEGSYAAIQCEGFKSFNVHSTYETDKLHNATLDAANAIVFDSTKKAKIPFIVTGNDLQDFISEVNYAKAKPFVIGTDGGKMFTITKGFLDNHSQQNPVNTPAANTDLKGIFLVEADMMVWGFMKKDGTTRKPLSVKATNILYSHAEGITAKINMANPVPVASKSEMDGWNYVLENLNFEIDKNAYTVQDVKGKIELPIVADGEFMNFDGQVGWDAAGQIPTATFNVDTVGKTDFSMPFLPAVLLMIESGTEVGFTFAKGNTRSEFSPNAKISGKMGIKITPLDNAYKALPVAVQEALPLEFVLGGIMFQDMKLNHPDDMNAAAGCIDNQGVVGGIKTFSIASFGIDTTSVLGDLMNNNPAYNAFKDKAAGALEGFPISIENVTFRCDKHKNGTKDAGGNPNYDDMFKLQFDIIVNLMPGEQESDVDDSNSDQNADQVDDSDDPIESIAGLFDEGGATPAPVSQKPKSTAGIAAAGQFGLWFKPKKDGNGGQDLVFDHVSLDALKVDAKFSILTMTGTLMCYTDDPTYGDGFKGYLKVDISKNSGGAMSGQAKGFQIQAIAQFGTTAFDYGNGNIQKEKYKDDPFRYFFVDLEAIYKQGVGAKIALHGIGGGFFFNMARENSKTLDEEREKALAKQIASGQKPKAPQKLPDEIDYSKPVLEGVDSVFITPGANMSGYKYYPQKGAYGGYLKGIFSVAKRPDLASFDIGIGLELKKNSAGNLGLSKIFARGDLYVQGDADITLRKEAPGQGYVDITYDHVNSALTCDFGFNFAFKRYINPADTNSMVTQELLVTGAGGMLFSFKDPKKWYVKIGKPQLADRLAMEMKQNGLSLNTMRAYIQFGHDLDDIPKLHELIPGWPSDFDPQDKTRPDLSGGDGLMFGVNFQMVKFEKEFLMFKAYMEAGGGFDLKVAKYTGISCANTPDGSFGMNNWYAMGQAYAYLKAGVSMDVDIPLIYSGEVSLFEAMAAIALQAQLPNPSWMRGAFYGQFSVLNGLVEGECRFQFELGEKCQIKPGTDFLNKVELITDMSPDSASTNVPIFASAAAGFAIPQNRQFLVKSLDKGGNEIMRRFIPFIKKAELKTQSGNVVNGTFTIAPDGYTLTFQPDEMLEPQTDYEFLVNMRWKEYLNNKWEELPQGETRVTKFKTGKKPNRIYAGMIGRMAPGEGQRYWHKNYAYAELVFKYNGMDYLFPKTSTELKSNSTMTQGMANVNAIPNDIPLNYYIQLIEYDKNGTEQRTIRLPITKFPNAGNQTYTYNKQMYKSYANTNIKMPYMQSFSTTGMKLEFDQLNSIDLKKGYMYEFSIKREPSRSYMAISASSAAQNVAFADSMSSGSKVNKKVTTLNAGNAGNAAIGDLYATYYTSYFAVSNYESLDKKLNQRQSDYTYSSSGSKSYEYPSNINLPSASWAMAKGSQSIRYSLFKLPEPLDEYDKARLNINLKRLDLPYNSDKDYFYGKKYKYAEGKIIDLFTIITENGKTRYVPTKWVKMENPTIHDYPINWYNYHRANEIPAAVKACGGVSGTDAVRFENFMTNIMQPYYKRPDWAYRLVYNSGMESKSRISSMEQGAKKLNNNVQGSFPGIHSHYNSHTFAIVNLDGYILSVQAKMARTLALLNFEGKCSQLSNYKHSLMYFLPQDAGLPAGKKYERYPISLTDNRYQSREASDFSDKYYAEYSSLYKWKSPLQDVSQSERTNTIVFRSHYGTNYNPPPNNNNNNNSQNGVLKVRGSYGKFTLDYNDNSMSFNYLTIRNKNDKVLYHWDGVKNESYEYIYDKNGYLVETKNHFDLPATRNGRVLEGNYPNADYTVAYVGQRTQWGYFNGGKHNTVNSNNGNSIALSQSNGSASSNQVRNNKMLTFDYDYSKNQVIINNQGTKVTIYDVTNNEDRRVYSIIGWERSGGYYYYDYRTQTRQRYNRDKPMALTLTPGRTYHVYYEGRGISWVKLDDTFWKNNKGRLRVGLVDYPKANSARDWIVDFCKTRFVAPESTPQFAYSFKDKGEQIGGESKANWQSASDTTITKAFQKGNGFTIEAKIKPLKGTATIANFPNGSLKMIDGKLQMEMNGSSTVVANNAMSLDKWHHIAAVYSKNGNIVQFFIDGKQDKSQTLSGTWSVNSGDKFSGSGQMVLDDITIWKSVRTRQQLIQTGTAKTPTITNDVIINYDFSNGTGERLILDLSNNKINGTLVGGDCYCNYEKSKYDAEAPIPVTVAYNYVLDFDGDEYVNVPNVALSNSAFTLESYIKAKSTTKDGALVSTNNITVLAKANGAFTNKYNVSVTFQNNGKAETLTASTALDIDKWYHIAIVQDAIQNGKTTVRVLIDGVQVTMKKDIVPIAFANDLKIGGNGSANFDGQIDMLRLWNIPRKIVSISNSIRNDDDISGEDLTKLLVHYDFDVGGPGKSVLNDRTSNTKDGTLTNMEVNEDWVLSDRTPIPTSGGNFVMRFDGNQDYVEVNHNDKLNIGNNFTFEFWAKTNTSLSGHTWLIQKLNSYGVYVRDGNELSISTWGEDGNFGKHTYITDNDWHHYTITGENGKGLSLYIDGLLTKTISGNFAPNTGNQKLYIGSAPNGSAINVMVDNVMIWNKSLNATDVKKHYESPSTDTKDLALFYNFNSGNTKTVLGRSTNRLNGVMSANMTSDDWQPVNGDFENGYAIDFDGKDDKLQTTIPLGNQVTYEAWINVDNFHDVAPYAMHIMGHNGKDGIAAMRLVLIGSDRYLQGAFNVGDKQMVFHGKTPIKAKQWYKVKVQYDRGSVSLWVNDKQEVNHRDYKTDELSAKVYPFTVGSSNSVDAFDGVIANIKVNDEHFKLQEGQGSATVKSQNQTLTMQNMDKNIVWLPFNPIYGNPAIKYPNAGITKPSTTGNKVYTINDDKSLANHLSFNIPVNETITELSVNYSDGRPVFYWTEAEGILYYKYVVKNGQTVLDKIELIDYKTPIQCGTKFPVRLENGTYNIEVKKNGQTLRATHKVGDFVFTDLQ